MTDTEIQAAFDKALGPMVQESAQLISDDINAIVLNKEDLSSPDMIGSELQSTTPQEQIRVDQLKAMGRPLPETPRYNTGFMLSQLKTELDNGSAKIFFPSGLEEAVVIEQQEGSQGTSKDGRWPFPVPARPFFGVSERALDGVQKIVDKAGEAITSALDSSVTRVTITINQS